MTCGVNQTQPTRAFRWSVVLAMSLHVNYVERATADLLLYVTLALFDRQSKQLFLTVPQKKIVMYFP